MLNLPRHSASQTETQTRLLGLNKLGQALSGNQIGYSSEQVESLLSLCQQQDASSFEGSIVVWDEFHLIAQHCVFRDFAKLHLEQYRKHNALVVEVQD